jgi:hypothetical protein
VIHSLSTLVTRDSRARSALDVALCTFAILALELGLIRWVSGQIRIIAYFANLILLAAFLGMGLGIALGRRRPGLVHLALPALALLAVVLAFAKPLGIMAVRFPDQAVFLWGADAKPANIFQFFGVTVMIAVIFWAVAGIFALAASPLGKLFDSIAPLRAYSADVAGSLAGIVAVTLISAAGATPWQWIALGALPLLWLSRTWLSLAGTVVALALAWHSGRGAFFSPYNRIDLTATGPAARADDPLRRDWELAVNRDYHQRVLDLSNARAAMDATVPGSRTAYRQAVYELPFRLRPTGTRGLVVGAGTGNDVAAGLRAGYAHVTAVDIDPTIIALGKSLHPEDPYASPRVRIVQDDARSPDDRFDVVAYGLVDSHAMFSAMSSLRLDNYVYTVEGIRAGWEHVAEDGVLAVSFSTFAGPWIEQRLLRTIREATGLTPSIVRHQMNFGASFLVSRSLQPALVPALLARSFELQPAIDESARMPTDDWPFLYMKPATVPFGYLTVLLFIAVSATVAIRRVYRRESTGSADARANATMFLMGAGFMLLETRMVTELSLLFGSTWIVNACVFAGVLVMVLLANLWVSRRPPASIVVWFAPLLASIVAVWALGAGTLNVFDITTRGLLGGTLFALPVAFAGIIVATLLARSPSPGTALGYNLLGSVLGGILEYSSMFLGLRFVALLALLCYGSALVCAALMRRRAQAGISLEAAAES